MFLAIPCECDVIISQEVTVTISPHLREISEKQILTKKNNHFFKFSLHIRIFLEKLENKFLPQKIFSIFHTLNNGCKIDFIMFHLQ